ncbi:MAG: hypothetical protein E6I39_12090 [Chloroflexi bacterium]|nr:MAG: hypothetical protein E6I98_01415 [Chloroflexota bacterium]TME97608.1 MAG: hypothetical protein E6I39_12090 [Chloroflexota bacterium]
MAEAVPALSRVARGGAGRPAPRVPSWERRCAAQPDRHRARLLPLDHVRARRTCRDHDVARGR